MAEIVKMKERPLLMAVFQIKKDPSTIAGFRLKLSDALNNFTVWFPKSLKQIYNERFSKGNWIDKHTAKA
jgi:hypothetical protein